MYEVWLVYLYNGWCVLICLCAAACRSGRPSVYGCSEQSVCPTLTKENSRNMARRRGGNVSPIIILIFYLLSLCLDVVYVSFELIVGGVPY